MLSLLAPRYYSISSSPANDPARCSVTAAVVEAPASSGRGIYRGVCSNYLAHRRVGDAIHATVRETKAGFRLPDDTTVPIIMIGPGTGLAPFRGFLQERAARKAQGARLGAAMLFFGCATPNRISSMPTSSRLRRGRYHGTAHGVLAPDGQKTYVQHLVAAQTGKSLEPDRTGRDHLCLRRRRQDGARRQGCAGRDLWRAKRR